MTAPQTAIEPSAASSSVEVVAIPPGRVWVVAKIAAPLIDKATQRTDRVTTGDLIEACRLSQKQLWIVWDTDVYEALAAYVTELRTYNGTGVLACRVVALGGKDLKRWKALAIASLEAYARAEDCDVIDMVGRPGWGRIFPDYRETERVYTKELA